MALQLAERIRKDATINDVQTELIFVEKIMDALNIVLKDLDNTIDSNFVGIKQSLKDSDHIRILEKFEAQTSLMQCSVKEAKQLLFSMVAMFNIDTNLNKAWSVNQLRTNCIQNRGCRFFLHP